MIVAYANKRQLEMVCEYEDKIRALGGTPEPPNIWNEDGVCYLNQLKEQLDKLREETE